MPAIVSIPETSYFKDLDFLQSVIDVLTEGVVLQNQEGKIVGFNEGACRILNLSSDQLLGKTSFDDTVWQAIHLNGEPAPGHTHPITITLRTGQPINDMIMGVKAGNQQVRWLSVSTRLVTVGNEQLAFAAFADLTELITSNHDLVLEKEKLKTSEEKFEQSFRYSAIGKAIVSTKGYVTDANDALCKMLGYPKEELLQKSFEDITFPDDFSKDMTLFQKLLKKEIETYQLEKRYIRKDGQVIWGILNVAPIWGADQHLPKFLVAQVQEITETKKLNRWLEERNTELLKTQTQLKRKIGQLRDFAGIITHDVRGPAGNIKKMLELYESSEDAETKQTAFHYLKKVSHDLTDNLNELVQVLQIHLEKEIPASNCDFATVTESVCLQLQNNLQQKGARIETDFEVASIEYPKVYLHSILYNLISNSLKYSREDLVPLIRIKTRMQDNHIHLSVADNGLGIDMEKFGKSLFHFQKSFHTGYDSKGIGLYLIRNQVEDLGGIIFAESEVNRGSVFTVRF